MSAADNGRSGAHKPPVWDEEDQELLKDVRPHLAEQGLSTQDHPDPPDTSKIHITIRKY
jgi:hypothetical protein